MRLNHMDTCAGLMVSGIWLFVGVQIGVQMVWQVGQADLKMKGCSMVGVRSCCRWLFTAWVQPGAAAAAAARTVLGCFCEQPNISARCCRPGGGLQQCGRLQAG
jgi:hypothetical protein